MKKEVLEKRRRILGEEHPSTISAMNNLANTLGEQGQLDEAITILEVAVQKMKRIHGEEHPHTEIAINNWTILVARRAAYEATTADNDSNKDKNKGSSFYTRFKKRLLRKAS
jgi:hypothetical protein